MLFLYRPRQTWLPIKVPRNMAVQQQRAYNLQMQNQFDATRRVAAAPPVATERDPVDALQRLGDMYTAGTLNDEPMVEIRSPSISTSPL